MKPQVKITIISILFILYGALTGVGFFEPLITGTAPTIFAIIILFITAFFLMLTQPWARFLAIFEALSMLANSYLFFIRTGVDVLYTPEFITTTLFSIIIIFLLSQKDVKVYFSDIRQPGNN